MLDQNLRDWIGQADTPKHKKERQVIHIILNAVSKFNTQFQVALKGGVLIALIYGSTRHTRDIDFSTRQPYSKDSEEKFIASLEKTLMENDFGYPIKCKVQSFKIKPPQPPQTFPTLKIKIGYADLGNRNSMKRLELKNATETMSIDYSFNEIPIGTKYIDIIAGRFIEIYDFNEIVSEKLRALIQQKDRNRTREQDVYDLYFLLSKSPVTSQTEKKDILNRLKKKSASRNVVVAKDSLEDPEIIMRSKRDYKSLEDTIEGDLPPFEESFPFIQEFYRNLPW